MTPIQLKIDSVLNSRWLWRVLNLIVLLFVALLVQFKFDDGWATLTIDNYLKTSKFSYVIYYNDAEYTFQKVWFWLISLLRSATDNVYALRIPAIIFSYISWLCLDSVVLRILGRRPSVLSSIFWYFCVYAFLITLRAESVLVAALAALLWMSMKAWLDRKVIYLMVAPILFSVVIASHPIGLFCLFIYFFYLAIVVINHKLLLSARTSLILISTVAIGSILTVRLVLWNLSLEEFIQNLNIVSSESTHARGIADEAIRYRFLFENWPIYGTVLISVSIVSTLFLVRAIAVELKARALDDVARYIYYFVCAPIPIYFAFLIIYPAKWEHYFALLCPFIFIIICVSQQYSSAIRRFSTGLSYYFVMIFIVLEVGMPAAYHVMGSTQKSYLKAGFRGRVDPVQFLKGAVQASGIEFEVGVTPRYFIEPYLYPYFNFRKESLIPIDLRKPESGIYILGCDCGAYYAEKFGYPTDVKLLSSFYFEGKKLRIFEIKLKSPGKNNSPG